MSIRLQHDVFCEVCGRWETLFVSHKQELRRAGKEVKILGWKTAVVDGEKIHVCDGCEVPGGIMRHDVDMSNWDRIPMHKIIKMKEEELNKMGILVNRDE